MAYSYDRTAAIPPVVRYAAKLKAAAIKAVHAYGKASDVWRDYKFAVSSLEPSFNGFGEPKGVEKALSEFKLELKTLESDAQAVSNRTVELFNKTKELEELVKASPQGKR